MPVRVVIIDDVYLNARLIEQALRKLDGVVTEIFQGPHQALERLASAPVHLVILDYRLPGMSGVDVLTRMRAMAHLATVPVLAVTGVTDPAAMDALRRAGADDLLRKPLNPDVLRDRCARLIARHRIRTAGSGEGPAGGEDGRRR